MASKAMYEVMQQAVTLPLDEKLRVMAVLTEQVRHETRLFSNGEEKTNGHTTDVHETTDAQADKPDPYRQREYAWLKQHRHEFIGQYLALDGDRLVSHGTDGRTVLETARRAGVRVPLMVRVSEDDELPFCGGW